MIPVIAGQGCSAYLGAMFSAVLRMIALIALVLMPLGMTAAPVAAAPATHETAASPAAGHCDEHQKPAQSPLKAQMHCTACAALAAPLVPAEVAELLPQAPMHIRLTYFGAAFEPEIATPPPKLA